MGPRRAGRNAAVALKRLETEMSAILDSADTQKRFQAEGPTCCA